MVITTIAGRREQQHGEVLRRLEPLGPDVAQRQQQREEQRRHHEDAEEDRERVDPHHPGHGDGGTVVADVDPLPGQRAAGGEGAEEGDHGGDGHDRRARAQERAEQHDEDAGTRQRQHRRQRQPVDVRPVDRVRGHRGEQAGAHFSAPWRTSPFGTDGAFGPRFDTPGSR